MNEDRGFRGLELLDQVIKQIETEPETWRQNDWAVIISPCQTKYCVAGHAVVMCGGQMLFRGSQHADDAVFEGQRNSISRIAQELLELTDSERQMLFSGVNDLDTIKDLRDAIAQRMEQEKATNAK